MRSLEQVNIRTNVRTYVRTYSHTYVRDRPYIPSTTLLCEGIIIMQVLMLAGLNIPESFMQFAAKVQT